MHELSIVNSIVDIATEHATTNSASEVDKIELEIGELAGIDWSALDFVWDVGVQQSVLEHAEREIIRIPGRVRCLECSTEFQTSSLYASCPNCSSYFSQVLQGKELRVKALTLK